MMETRYTLSQLQRDISQSLSREFSAPLWISAEVSDMKVNGSGHCYVELVEKGDGDGVARAQARGVLWRKDYGAISKMFEQQTGMRLGRGVTILAKVKVSYHELYGLSLQIVEIDPTYTVGEVERERLRTIARLKENGSWGINRGHKVPMVVQRIAVVSSAQAAGYQDFMRELDSALYRYEITLFEAIMQGVQCEESVVSALLAIADRREEFDAVVLIRGGGSVNDLNCYNTYKISLYVARFPLPIVAGIGHDKDVSVVDMVANMTLKTPTAVATWLNERMMTLDGWLLSAAHELRSYAVDKARRGERLLEGMQREVVARAEELVVAYGRRLDDMSHDLRERPRRLLEQRAGELNHADMMVESFAPRRLMEIGFSVVRMGGVACHDTNDISVGQQITVQLSSGSLEADVTKILR